MPGRNGFFCCCVIFCGLVATSQTAPALAGDNPPEAWNRAKAAGFLDARGEQWFNFGSSHRGKEPNKSSCISCHSLLSYALARPVLRQISKENVPTQWEARVLEQTKSRVSNWDKLSADEFQLMYDFDDAKKLQSRGTEAVLNALVLARDDRFKGRRKPSDDTKKALANMWATQVAEGKEKGSWDWINFGMDPWEGETSRYMGACLAAIAVGSAPGYDPVGATGDLKERVGFLRNYLKKQFASENLHNRVWMLWASASIDGLMNQEEKNGLIAQVLAKQQAGGGWSLGSLGSYSRKDVKDPDGYATGLILHVLQLAGLPKENPQISKGLSWLRSNQDPTGAWRAASVNKNRDPQSKDPAKAHIGKFMWDAATAYSVLALSH
jgi:squalene-hopene/tetraprenyl-beta-curcumene cyclase